MNAFIPLFLALLLEALPFVIIGAIISALIELYISPEWITQRVKGASVLSYFTVALMGFFIPVCECAIIPVVRKLLKKGLPLGLGITFMLAVPIVNPVVLLSTYYAFGDNLNWVLARGISGWTAAVIIGLLVHTFSKDAIKSLGTDESVCTCGHNHLGHQEHCGCEHDHIHHQECACDHHEEHDELCSCGHHHVHGKKLEFKELASNILSHSANELINVGVLLTFGAFISALIQVYLPKSTMVSLSQSSILSAVIMMLFAFILSLCSEADAFIAASFSTQIQAASILAFLVFGPMLDIKNLFMLNATFKPKFVIKLSLSIAMICFIISTLYGTFVL